MPELPEWIYVVDVDALHIVVGDELGPEAFLIVYAQLAHAHLVENLGGIKVRARLGGNGISFDAREFLVCHSKNLPVLGSAAIIAQSFPRRYR